MKNYVIISGIVGGIIGSVLTALLVSPVTAQRDKIGDIGCTSLRVVAGGTVTVYGKDGELGALLGVDEHGGIVFTMDRYGQITSLE